MNARCSCLALRFAVALFFSTISYLLHLRSPLLSLIVFLQFERWIGRRSGPAWRRIAWGTLHGLWHCSLSFWSSFCLVLTARKQRIDSTSHLKRPEKKTEDPAFSARFSGVAIFSEQWLFQSAVVFCFRLSLSPHFLVLLLLFCVLMFFCGFSSW